MFDDFDPLCTTSTLNSNCENAKMISTMMTSDSERQQQQQQQQQFDDQFSDLVGGFHVSDISNTSTVASSEFSRNSDVIDCKADDRQNAIETNANEV